MPQIVLVRHGQASFGGLNYDVLSDVGVRQVQLARAALDERGIKPSVVVCGSLQRQRDTAAAWDQDAVVDPRWNEYESADVLRGHGAPGLSPENPGGDTRAFQAVLDEALAAWVATAESPCEEPWPAFYARVGAAFDAVADRLGPGETALVVTSGGAIAAVATRLLDVPHAQFLNFNRVTVNAAFTKVVIGRSGRTLVSFNEHDHLDRAGLVTYR